MNIRDVQDVIEMAIGGMNLMETVEGRERYPVRIRYLREFREDIPELEKILLPSSTMAQVPLAQVVTIKSVLGPQEIKGERGLLTGYVTMNTRDRDEVSVVEDSERLLQAALKDGRLVLPAGYYWEWSGQFENQVRATKRMQIFGLMPVFWATGRGADIMKPIALPSLGGMAVSVITMFIVPCLFSAVEEWKWKRTHKSKTSETSPQPEETIIDPHGARGCEN